MKYLSVDQAYYGEIVIKKSRFISCVMPLETEPDARQNLEDIRKKWPQAAHYCYAMILREPAAQKYSDDGEPSGTAGTPILQVLKNFELKNVLAVVIRYFGGTLLGASGLVRAYSEAVITALNQAHICEYMMCRIYTCSLEYSFWADIERNLVRSGSIRIKKIEFSSQVELEILVPLEKEDRIIDQLNASTNGSIKLRLSGEGYFPGI